MLHVDELKMDDFKYSHLHRFHPEEQCTPADVDIVLVAGLGGHCIETWEAKDKTVWPRDLLAQHLTKHKLRVMSYNYNMTLKGTTSQASLRNHADDLLHKLFIERGDGFDPEASIRPIVFVGHSLGGMLIKQALTRAAGNWGSDTSSRQWRDHRFRSIWKACRGVMFFATPHLGMASEVWPHFTRHVLQLDAPIEGASPSGLMVKELELNNETLYKLTEDFHSLRDSLAFVTFLEKKAMSHLGLLKPLVDVIHGQMHGATEKSQMLDGDHVGLCKIPRTPKGLFTPVWRGIKFLISSKMKPIDSIGDPAEVKEAQEAVASLCPDDFHNYFLDKQPVRETCTWLSERPEVKDWLNGTAPGKPWLSIQGPPGCGKSFMARHVLTELLPPGSEPIHCFLSKAAPDRDNLSALLRATLHQALQVEPRPTGDKGVKKMFTEEDIIPLIETWPEDDEEISVRLHPIAKLIKDFILPEFEKFKNLDTVSQELWGAQTLEGIWPEVVSGVAACSPLTIVVDGFDEIGAHCRAGFLRCLERLDAVREDTARFKLLILSRDDIDLAQEARSNGLDGLFRGCSVTPRDVEGDIKLAVKEELGKQFKFGRQGTKTSQKGAIPEESAKVLAQDQVSASIAEASGGNYMWATAVAEELRRTKPAEQWDPDPERLPPRSLEMLYIGILDKLLLRPQSAHFVRVVLLFTVFQQGRLTEEEFNTAQAVSLATEKKPLGEPISEDDLSPFLIGSIGAKIDFYCGQLVKLREGGRLELIHRSLEPYVIDKLGEEESHARIANICITYLMMPQFQEFANTDAGTAGSKGAWETKVRKRLREQHFLRYAARFWHKHHKSAGPVFANRYPEAEKARAEELENSKSNVARMWTEAWWFLTKGAGREYPRECPVEDIVRAEIVAVVKGGSGRVEIGGVQVLEGIRGEHERGGGGAEGSELGNQEDARNVESLAPASSKERGQTNPMPGVTESTGDSNGENQASTAARDSGSLLVVSVGHETTFSYWGKIKQKALELAYAVVGT